jgi:hypothetical protein
LSCGKSVVEKRLRPIGDPLFVRRRDIEVVRDDAMIVLKTGRVPVGIIKSEELEITGMPLHAPTHHAGRWRG